MLLHYVRQDSVPKKSLDRFLLTGPEQLRDAEDVSSHPTSRHKHPYPWIDGKIPGWHVVEEKRPDCIWGPFHTFASEWFEVEDVFVDPRFSVNVHYNGDFDRIDFVYLLKDDLNYSLTFCFEHGVPQDFD